MHRQAMYTVTHKNCLQKMYSDFELQGIEEDKLNSKIYQTVMDRIKMEEAAASVSNGLQREADDFEYVLICCISIR